jgi:type II secretory pathway pseudopilin PulG
MIELLVVVVILALLIIILMWFLRNQPYKARDAKRKADIKQYQVAFEDYFNDHAAYPAEGAIDNCNGPDLRPYVNNVLCDPGAGNLPYDYLVGPEGDWYAVCADLENETDPDIAKVGCAGGCGTGLAYDYCTTAGIPISDIAGELPEGGEEGGETEGGGQYACDSSGVCNDYGAGAASCLVNFAANDCEGYCSLPRYSDPTAVPPTGEANPAYYCGHD